VQDDIELVLRYRWEPGEPGDGVTALVPLALLNQLRAEGFDWNIPGVRAELITALVRSLPKAIRRSLVPAADTARHVLATTGPEDGPLLTAVASSLSRISGEAVTAGLWAPDAVPPHLRIRFEVFDEDGQVLGRGRDLEQLRHEMRHEVLAAIARAAPELERHGETRWDFGDLPTEVSRGALRAYPSLVDEDTAVGVALLDTRAAQVESMWRGTRRLLLLAAPLPAGHVQRRLTNETKLVLARSATPLADLLADCSSAVADQIIVAHGGPAFDAAGFEAMAVEAREGLVDRCARQATTATKVLVAAGLVEERAARLAERDRAGALSAALADVRRQLGELTRPGFVSAVGPDRLADLLRYVEAASRRLERLPADARRDAERQAVIERLRTWYERSAGEVASAAGAGASTRLSEVRWMIEELRVSLWAQSLGTPAPVSEERIMRALGRVTA
jgi:ATP-dependent helicase HrpA